MEAFKQRLFAEEKELNERLQKALKFQETEKYKELDFVDQTLLYEQGLVMKLYRIILHHRIHLLMTKEDWQEAVREKMTDIVGEHTTNA